MDKTDTVDGEGARPTAIVLLSLAGAAAMAGPALLQLGFVRDLPDPKLRLFGMPFRSRKVNLSRDAYVLGMRDAPIALASLLANVPLVLAARRARQPLRSWLMLGFAAKAFGEAIGSGIFFSKMPRKEKAWCAYCVGAAVASVGIFALSIPGAKRAIRSLRAGARNDG